MGKVVERIKLSNFIDPSKIAEVEAIIDTGATMLALPIDLVNQLGLQKFREVSVRYANNRTERKGIYGVITLEIQGRSGHFDVLAEESGSKPLIGQVVLEELDLVINSMRRNLILNSDKEYKKIQFFLSTSKSKSKSDREFRKWQDELSFFNSIKRKLLKDDAYRNKFIAIKDKKIIDSDIDNFRLVKRINEKYYNEVVLIVKVEMGVSVVEIPSPEVIHEI